jgi:hypothetical protein
VKTQRASLHATSATHRNLNNGVNNIGFDDSNTRNVESVDLRKNITLMTAVGMLALLVLISPVIDARRNGVGSGTEEYDCGGSCHSVLSSATITMFASNLTPATGQSLTVTVNVSGGSSDAILGVMIVSSLSPVPASIPSAAGWVITTDPSGLATYNYHEITDYASQTSMTWTLTAPQQTGIYNLYARVMHGSPSGASEVEYAKDYVDGLSFIVGSAGLPGIPNVVLTSPTEGSTVKGSMTVNANIPSSQPIAYAVLKLDGVEIGNKTVAPFAWTIDTRAYADGDHVLNITALDVLGNAGYKQVTVDVDNSATNTELLSWVWTMAAGSIAIVAWIGVMIVVALMIRRRHTMKEGK